MTVDELFPLPPGPRPVACRSPYDSLFQRLVANSEADPDNPRSCWVWTGKVRSGGSHAYPHINVWRDGSHKTLKAHRIMMEEALGRPLDPWIEVDHRCHNTLCINPDHLREATFVQNQNNRRGYRPVTCQSRD